MLRRLVVILAFGALAAVPAHAAVTLGGVGPRVGFSVDPDQLVVGGQMIVGEVAPDLTFDPSLEFGFGDNRTTVAFNFDLHYHFAISGSAWRPYAGGGVTLNFESFDNDFGNDSSDTDVGGGLVLGAGVPTKSGNRFFTELKLGLGDVPSLKMVAGWNFKI